MEQSVEGTEVASVTLWLEKASSLNGKGLHELIYLNSWSSVVGDVWEQLEDVGLLEGICHSMWTL